MSTNILNPNSIVQIQLEENLNKWKTENSDKNSGKNAQKSEKRDSRFFFWKRKSSGLKK